jgi:GNAT superfamily N-acetyltransferase
LAQSRHSIEELDDSFHGWDRLLNLLHVAFEPQKGRIDPPSSVYELDENSLRSKALEEHVFLATDRDLLVGCVFAKDTGNAVYLGKLAVLPEMQGRGIGRLLVERVAEYAKCCGRSVLELETRIELIDNHQIFEKYGFQKVSESAHPGYDHPTSIAMEKRLDA